MWARFVAQERIPFELSPTTYPGRHVARDTYPQRQVARESPDLSLGIVVNVVVRVKANTVTILPNDPNGIDIERECGSSDRRWLSASRYQLSSVFMVLPSPSWAVASSLLTPPLTPSYPKSQMPEARDRLSSDVAEAYARRRLTTQRFGILPDESERGPFQVVGPAEETQSPAVDAEVEDILEKHVIIDYSSNNACIKMIIVKVSNGGGSDEDEYEVMVDVVMRMMIELKGDIIPLRLRNLTNIWMYLRSIGSKST
ncbi:hypothetical protein Tco_0499822 [Tanacetum coccineum]